jgi:hypothetical protein
VGLLVNRGRTANATDIEHSGWARPIETLRGGEGGERERESDSCPMPPATGLVGQSTSVPPPALTLLPTQNSFWDFVV